MTIKQLPEQERPYEKLKIYGADKLSNAELLAIIIKNGTKDNTAIDIANKILNLNKKIGMNNLRFMQDLSIEDFTKIKGIGIAKAITIKAFLELSKRMSKPIDISNTKIKCTKDVADILMDELRYEKREITKAIILNTKNNILKIIDVAIGGTNSVNITPKDIFTENVKLNAPKIIMVHNHPSGDPTPSNSDIETTKRMEKCAELLGIKLLDHVIIGDGKFASVFSERKGLCN